MPQLRISSFHTSMLIKDQPPHTLPASVVTDLLNVKFKGSKLQLVNGYVDLYSPLDSSAMYLLGGFLGEEPWLLIFGNDNVYKLYQTVLSDITGDLVIAAAEGSGWVGDVLHGIGVATNSAGNPLQFDGSTLDELGNWPPADLSTCICKSLRAYRNFLVAGNLTEDGTVYPQVLRWSHPADPGAVPASWDISDVTKDAGRTALSETPGYILDSYTLGDSHIIYKNDSTYIMRYVGGVFVHSFQLLSNSSGIIAKDCFANVGFGHVVLTDNDVVLVTISSITSIADNIIRQAIFDLITEDNADLIYLTAHPARSEVWIVIPSTDGSIIFVWNYQTKKWFIQELPRIAHILSVKGQYDDIIDHDSGIVEEDHSVIDSFKLLKSQLVGINSETAKLAVLDIGVTANGTAISGYAKHESYDFADVDGVGADRVKHITRIRPHFAPELTAGTVVKFRIGVQMDLSDPITWSGYLEFTGGVTRDLYVRVNGRYISWEISSDAAASWSLDSLDITYSVGGLF